MFKAIRSRILWKIFAIFWLTTISVGLANVFLTTQIVRDQTQVETLQRTMNRLVREAVNVYENNPPRELARWYRQVHRNEGLRVRLETEAGRVLGLPPNGAPDGLPPPRQPRAFSPTAPESQNYPLWQPEAQVPEPSPRGFERLAKSVEQTYTSQSGRVYRLVLLPSKGLRETLAPPSTLPLIRFAVSFILILLGSWWLSRSIVRPVNVLIDESQRIAQGDFNAKAAYRVGQRKDEIGTLAVAFDAMAERINDLLASQRQLFRNISHDIRTPLTRQKLAIELARTSDNPGPMLDKLEQQNTAIEKLLDDLLSLMRLENNEALEKQTLSLSSLVLQCCDEAQLEADAKGQTILIDVISEISLNGDPALIKRALDNVLANAIRYSPASSQITVRAKQTNLDALISVEDAGPGIPEADLKKVTEPFFKSDQSRQAGSGGYGLGLAIVDRIAQQHNGALKLENLKPTGLRARIVLSTHH